MRKFILWLMLAAAIFTVSISGASASEPTPNPALHSFSDFGLYRRVEPNEEILIYPDGETHYGNTNSFRASDYFLAAKVSMDYNNNMPLPYNYLSSILPSGTLTLTSGDTSYEGNHYILRPNQRDNFGDEQFIRYNINAFSLSDLEENKIFWNIYTSPDVTVGNAVVPKSSQNFRTIGPDEAIPYVKIIQSADNPSFLESIAISFVKSGDWSNPVDPGISKVKVNVNWSRIERTFENFSGTQNISFPEYEGNFYNLTISYEKDHELYTWTFRPAEAEYSSIEWGGLDLTNQPLIITAGTEKEITLKLPSSINPKYTHTRYEYDDEGNEISSHEVEELYDRIIRTGNDEVLVFDKDSLSFDQGSGGYLDGAVYRDNKSTLFFRLLANNPGRTTLIIDLPNSGQYYREVNVVDSSGNITPTEDKTSGLHLSVLEHRSRARFFNGKPIYPSAEFESLRLEIPERIIYSRDENTGTRIVTKIIRSGDEDVEVTEEEPIIETVSQYVNNGFIGFKYGSTSEIHSFSGNYINNWSGVKYDTSDSSINTDNPGNSITTEDLSSCSVWWEADEIPGFVSDLKPITEILSSDFRTTAQQLEEFVPYFEMKYAEDNPYNVVSLDWSFINPKTNAKAERDGITNIRINNYEVAGTSGTIDFYNPYEIEFSYTYEGINYVWNFSNLVYNDYIYEAYSGNSIGSLYISDINIGTSRDVRAIIYKLEELEAIDFFVQNEGIISVEPVSFTPASTISFTVSGLKEGATQLNILFTRKGYNSFDKFTRAYTNIVNVVSEDIDEPEPLPISGDLSSSDLSVEVGGRKESRASIVEGRPNYYYSEDDETVQVTLIRDKFLLDSDYRKYEANLRGTLHVYSGDEELRSFDLWPHYAEGRYENFQSYTKPGYSFSVLPGAHIEWEFTDEMNLNNNGSYDIPAGQVRSTKTQLETYKPYVKLNRNGLNVESIEWYFADSQDNKITTPASIPADDIMVRVETYYYGEEIEDKDKDGIIELGIPEVQINQIVFSFKEDGMTYRWTFSPVDGGNPYSMENYYALDWDIASPDLPLIMSIGESKKITLTAHTQYNLMPFIGNSSIVSMEILESSDNSVTVELQALSAGMTSITLASLNGGFVAWPREIWVADNSGRVPNLTDNINTLIENLITEGTASRGGWQEPGSGEEPTPTEPTLKVSAPSVILIPDTAEITLTVAGDSQDKTRSVYIAGRSANAPALSVSPSTITGNGSASATFSSEGIASGYYDYVAVAGELVQHFSINVRRANFRIDADNEKGFEGPSLFENHTYSTIFEVDTELNEAIEWTFTDNSNSELHTIKSGDMFIVEGIAKRAQDENGSLQSFSVSAKSGTYSSEYNSSFYVNPEYFDAVQDGLNITGSHNNVRADYRVMLPGNIKGYEAYLPVWLRAIYDDDDYIIGVEFAGVIEDLANGTRATVRIYAEDESNEEAEDVYYGWDVVYNVAEETVTPTPSNPDPEPTPTPTTSPDINPSSPDVRPESPDITPTSPDITPTSPDINPASPDVPPTTSPDNPPEVSPDVPPVTSPDTPVPPVVSPDNPPVVSPDNPPVVSPDNPPVLSPDVPPATSPDTPAPQPGTDPEPGEEPGTNPTPGTTSDDEPATPPATSPDIEPGNGGGGSGQIDVPGDEPNVEPVAVRPEAPAVNIQAQSIVNTIINALQQVLSIVTGNTEVLSLNDNAAVGTERAPEDLSTEELSGIPETETPAAVLPIITVQRPAVYVFGVTLNNLEAGARIFLYMMAESITGAEFQSSADETNAYTFLNDDGEEITTVPANKHVNIAAYMEPGKTYAPIITTEASSSSGGGNGEENGDNSTSSVGSSSGGCNSGFSVIGLALLGLFASKRKK